MAQPSIVFTSKRTDGGLRSKEAATRRIAQVSCGKILGSAAFVAEMLRPTGSDLITTVDCHGRFSLS